MNAAHSNYSTGDGGVDDLGMEARNQPESGPMLVKIVRRHLWSVKYGAYPHDASFVDPWLNRRGQGPREEATCQVSRNGFRG